MMKNVDILKQYFEWLLQFTYDPKNYHELYARLNDFEFSWNIPMDENRELDGLLLRSDFDHIFNTNISCLNARCSMLEMLIALSLRLDEECGIVNPSNEESLTGHSVNLFFTMISNLDLKDMTNNKIDEEHIHSVLSNFVNNSYTNTEGGIFKTKNKRIKLNECDIWYQACFIMNEVLLC